MYIVSGCNGSGKTTATYTLLPEMFDCTQFINSDEFAKSLSPFDPSAASVTASRYLLMRFKYLINRKINFCIETTLATRSLLSMVRDAQAGGYEVTVLYLWLNSVDIAIQRVKARVDAGGHDIPEEVIRRRYHRGLCYFFNDYIPQCDKWILADNSCTPFSIVAHGNSNSTTIIDRSKYAEIWSQVSELAIND